MDFHAELWQLVRLLQLQSKSRPECQRHAKDVVQVACDTRNAPLHLAIDEMMLVVVGDAKTQLAGPEILGFGHRVPLDCNGQHLP